MDYLIYALSVVIDEKKMNGPLWRGYFDYFDLNCVCEVRAYQGTKSVRYLNGYTCRSTLLIIDWGFESIAVQVVVSGLLSGAMFNTIVVLEVVTVLLSLTVTR
jgi:hypothetical protein